MRAFLTAAVFAFSMPAFAEVSVIVNSGNADALDKGTISKIYLGKSKSFPSGAKIEPVNLSDGGTLDEFNQKVLSKSSSQVNAYWSKLVFTGKGTPPKKMGSDAEVIAFVKSNPNAIGYVASGSVTGDVKVVATF